jgi:hypothetical protein
MRFDKLQDKANALLLQGRTYVGRKEMSAAKRCVLSRRRLMTQMDFVNNSICVLDTHLAVLEGMDLDMTVLRTLRASGEALKRYSVPGGMSAVDDIMLGVEEQMNEASELAKAVSVGGLPNTEIIDDNSLMIELELLTCEDSPQLHAPVVALSEQTNVLVPVVNSTERIHVPLMNELDNATAAVANQNGLVSEINTNEDRIYAADY